MAGDPIPRRLDWELVNGLYNLGDALWAVFGALVLLAIAIFVVGLKLAKAIGGKNPGAKETEDSRTGSE